jgi:predicted transcriptional regulator
MQTERFHQFVQMIEGIHKSVSKIRMIYAPCLGVKSVHLFWLYELLSHPDGLTASSLAATGKIDRSLVSREIEELCVGGYVEVIGGGGKGSGEVIYGSDDAIYYPKDETHVKYGDVIDEYNGQKVTDMEERPLSDEIKAFIDKYFSDLYYKDKND